jgi:hypothetical protein
MVIVWDERKRFANPVKRGLDFAELTGDFFLSATFVPAHSGRRAAIGTLANGLVTTIYLELGTEAISIISLRPASSKERALYEGV